MPNQPQDMVELARVVRLWVNPLQPLPSPGAAAGEPAGPFPDAWAATVELEVTCRGGPDRKTGYLLNISRIDAATRRVALPIVHRGLAATPQAHPAMILRLVTTALDAHLPGLGRVCWRLTPYHALAMTPHDPDEVVVSRQFEFAAAHRLHCPDLNPAANREIFGKCNNANGHGHNYRIEVSVRTRIDAARAAPVMGIPAIDRIVTATILDRFDHQHLNLDTTEFAALNPSVEHIARVCHELLDPAIRAGGAALEHVRIWETEKTSCTYPAPSTPR